MTNLNRCVRRLLRSKAQATAQGVPPLAGADKYGYPSHLWFKS